MLDELIVFHHPAGTGSAEDVPVPINCLRWNTCLREILFVPQRDGLRPLDPNTTWEVYRGEDSYRFLLEVICGLHSPLIGETAVLGQFREFCLHAKFPASEWGWFLSQFTIDLAEDAKRVRHRHLQGLGSQSYGSLVRQHITNAPVTAILGTGKLAREILPWLIGKTKVRLFYRNQLCAETLRNDYPQIELQPLTRTDAGWKLENSALVIAAPLTAKEIESWSAKQRTRFSKALDLRGEASSDPFERDFPVIKLPELFAALEADQDRMASHVVAARDEIKLLAQSRAQQAQFRPFGWEDLCA